MEIEEQQNQIQTHLAKHRHEKVVHGGSSSCSSSSSPSSSSSSAAEDQVKLAAVSITLNVRLRAADMPARMQEHAVRIARALAESSPRRTPNSSVLARTLKKEFDSVYGPAWHCVAGKSFGSFVTHSTGSFIYFSLEDSQIFVLLFKTQVQVVTRS